MRQEYADPRARKEVREETESSTTPWNYDPTPRVADRGIPTHSQGSLFSIPIFTPHPCEELIKDTNMII